MKFPHFFIERPIFAAVLSVLILVFGIVAYPTLPVAQYPEIAPPTVVVTASFPGANAETLAETVAAPLEQAINGVEHMIYMSSSSTGDGNTTITVTFEQGTNIDQAQVLVQNRVQSAEPRLPEQARQIGVTVNKNSPDILMAAAFLSQDGSLPQQYVSNYVTLQVLDRIGRIEGVGGARLFGGRDYNMRIWIDPDRAAGAEPDGGRGDRGGARAERAGRGRHGRPAAVQPRRAPPSSWRSRPRAGWPRPRSSAVSSSRSTIRGGSRGSAISPGSSSARRITGSTPIFPASR